jgi:hypothetical protein
MAKQGLVTSYDKSLDVASVRSALVCSELRTQLHSPSVTAGCDVSSTHMRGKAHMLVHVAVYQETRGVKSSLMYTNTAAL